MNLISIIVICIVVIILMKVFAGMDIFLYDLYHVVPYPVPHPVPYPRKGYGTAMAYKVCKVWIRKCNKALTCKVRTDNMYWPLHKYEYMSTGSVSRGNYGGSKEWESWVTTGLIVVYSQFFTCSNPHVDRCSNPLPWDPLSSPWSVGFDRARRAQVLQSVRKITNTRKYKTYNISNTNVYISLYAYISLSLYIYIYEYIYAYIYIYIYIYI